MLYYINSKCAKAERTNLKSLIPGGCFCIENDCIVFPKQGDFNTSAHNLYKLSDFMKSEGQMTLHFQVLQDQWKPYVIFILKGPNYLILVISEMYQTKTYNSNSLDTVNLNILSA